MRYPLRVTDLELLAAALEKLIVSPGVPHLYPRAHPVIQRA